jgi:hypothetical protein
MIFVIDMHVGVVSVGVGKLRLGGTEMSCGNQQQLGRQRIWEDYIKLDFKGSG